LRGYWQCGDDLNKVRASLKHGEWEPWREQNEQALGFGIETVRLLRNFAKRKSKPPWNLSKKQVDVLTAQLWGETKKGRYGSLTGDPEWITPIEIVERARRTLGHIDLDPASREEANREIIKADRFHTKQDSGLEHDWPGRVYVNPPYSHPLVKDFAYYLIDQYMRGITREAIWLSNASTSNAWWRDLAGRGVVCLTGSLSFGRVVDGKVKYRRQRSQFEQAVIYLGERRDVFCEEFYKIKTPKKPVAKDKRDIELEWWICEKVDYISDYGDYG